VFAVQQKPRHRFGARCVNVESLIKRRLDMKRSHFAILAALALVTAPALATTVTVHIGDPGYYGPVTVAGYPQPQLVYTEPVVVQRVQVVQEPVYVRVPVVQQQNWRSYCGRYNACNRPVYFVEDTWYRDVYAPQYRQRYRTQTTTYPERSTTYTQRSTTYTQPSTTYQQQRLATKQAEVNRKMDKEQQKVVEKTQKEQQKLAEKTEKEQEKLAKKAEKEQKKLDKKNHG
jgi:hypothetical protein